MRKIGASNTQQALVIALLFFCLWFFCLLFFCLVLFGFVTPKRRWCFELATNAAGAQHKAADQCQRGKMCNMSAYMFAQTCTVRSCFHNKFSIRAKPVHVENKMRSDKLRIFHWHFSLAWLYVIAVYQWLTYMANLYGEFYVQNNSDFH